MAVRKAVPCASIRMDWPAATPAIAKIGTVRIDAILPFANRCPSVKACLRMHAYISLRYITDWPMFRLGKSRSLPYALDFLLPVHCCLCCVRYGCPAPSRTSVEEEFRCTPYLSTDYAYPPSVEPLIVAKQNGIYSPYDLQCFSDLRQTDIEHIVARSEAHDSGLCAATNETRRLFARDLLNLTLASPRLNRFDKSDHDAGEWLPLHNKCWYADIIVRIKSKYDLTVDARESSALNELLRECADIRMDIPYCSPIRYIRLIPWVA